MNRVIWSTLGVQGSISFSKVIEWNGLQILPNQLLSLMYFEKPIEHTGKGHHALLKTVELMNSQKDNKFLLVTYLSESNVIFQIFCELNEPQQFQYFSKSTRNPILFILNPFGGTKAASKLFYRLIKPLITISSLPYELIGKQYTSNFRNYSFQTCRIHCS